jgi:hypothetical protein
MTDTKNSKPKKSRNIILVAVLIIAVLSLVWAEKSRRNAVHQLEQKSAQLEELKKSTENSSQDLANRVRENVSKLINLPLDPPPTVATISDVDKLRESNEFFTSANNGNYLVLTGNRAILYDLEKNIILDVAPFQVNQSSPTPTPKATPTPAP